MRDPAPSTDRPPLLRPRHSVTALPNVELLRWPAQEERRQLLATLGEPRLLLLADDTSAPALIDDLELFVPDDSPPGVVVNSVTALQQRALRHDADPVLDDDGLLRFRGQWVAISDSQLPVVKLLLRNYDRLVHNEDISRTYQDSSGSRSPASLRTLLRRVSQRLAKVGLKLHVVRRRGVILTREDDSG